MKRALPLVLLGILGCVYGDSPEPEIPEPPRLDVALKASESRAGEITRTSELIGGVASKGRPGDFKIYNDKIAVIIGQPGFERGYNPYGGTIVDADRIREDGSGLTRFGEVIVGMDLHVVRGDLIEVVSDGTDGQPAHLRVSGKLDEMPLFASLLDILLDSEPPNVDWTIDYVLRPGSQVLEITHTAANASDSDLTFGLAVSAFMFHNGVKPFVDGHGFTPPGQGGGTYYGAVGDDVSYLYARPGERLSLLINTSGLILSGLGNAFSLRARERKTISHYLVVGDGDLNKTQAARLAYLKEDPGAFVEGTVRDDRGRPVAGTRIHATLPENNDRYESVTVSDAEGRFHFALPSGETYQLVALSEGRSVARSSPFELVGNGASVDLVVPPDGRVTYEVRDDRGRSLPSKLIVRDVSRPYEPLPAKFGEARQSFGLVNTIFGETGQGSIALAPGNYEITASRGVEYEVVTQAVTVTAGQSVPFSATLARSVDTSGWLASDTHIHAQLSPDSPDLYPFKVRTMAVENIELPVSTEHEYIGDFNPAIEALGLGSWMNGIVGSEVTTFVYGHFNAFPLVPKPDEPGNGRVSWYDKTPAETFAAIRAHTEGAFIQVNHPRGGSVGSYFDAMGYDPVAFEMSNPEFSSDFDGIEVMNGCSANGIARDTIQDWFGFLNNGVRKIGVASSDNHKAASGAIGLPLTFVEMPTDLPAEAKLDDFRRSFHEGRLVLSCGPFLRFGIGEARIGDTVRIEGDTFELSATVAGPTWMDIDALDVIVNGRVVETIALTPTEGETVRFASTVTVSMAPNEDAWVALSARGDQRHGDWAQRRPSFALTNPIFIDRDGDGWSGTRR